MSTKLMTITRYDFASGELPPKGHHTAHSVRCFHNDPYVYYKTYVEHQLPKPP